LFTKSNQSYSQKKLQKICKTICVMLELYYIPLLPRKRFAMISEDRNDTKGLAEQNAALIALMEKVHRSLKFYKGQDNFNGQLFKVVDIELFKAKSLNPVSDAPANGRVVGVKICVVQKVEPAGERAAR